MLPEIRTIIHRLNSIATILRSAEIRSWTAGTKSALCEIGKELGYVPYANGGLVEGGQWLYDVAWLDYAPAQAGRYLKQVVLAAECDWGEEGDLHDDFEKLLQSTASVKLLIFGEKGVPPEKIVAECQQALGAFYPSPCGIFILACYENVQAGFRFFQLSDDPAVAELVA